MLKVVLSTISATLVVVSLLSSLFFNTILSSFGLVTTSVVTLNELRGSKKVVNTMQNRHRTKKLNVSKKFTKRTGKKISSTAVSAATIGTAGVVMTLVGLEVYDYCDEKRELLADENILFGTNKQFHYSHCLEEARKESMELVASVKDTMPEAVENAWEDTKQFSREKWGSTEQIRSDALNSTTDAANRLWKSFNEWVH